MNHRGGPRRPSRRLTGYARALRSRALRLLALCLLAVGLTAPAAAASAVGATPSGWLRLANLSPGTPAYDIYLYSVGDMDATLVLRNISYGMISRYQSLPAGGYTVAMRPAGRPASSTPVLSSTVSVGAGDAYTMADLGPSSAPRLELLDDTLNAPRGKGLVRIIQASVQQARVTVSANGHVLVRNLAFGRATTYAAVRPGAWRLRATGPTARATDRETWAAGASYTVVVLDGAGHRLELDGLTDGAGSKVRPAGSAPMGFGGTAPRPPASPLPWLAALVAGLAATTGGGLWLRRTRPVA